MKVRELGAYIRNQRNGAHMSLRRLSTLAGVSLPYLSQIERGLRRPSAEIMQAIAKALRISANTLYVQAGILDEHPKPDVHAAVMGDPGLTERQKQALLSVYASFRDETSRRRATRKGLPGEGEPMSAATLLVEAEASTSTRRPAASAARAAGATTTVRRGAGSTRARSTGRKRSSGRPETQAAAKPSPGSPSASRSPSFEPTKGGASR
ncbi:MAG TPA: helix-turn-helix transcriptional regulator [Actinomycetota bacterium]|jgi:transcriptional regulator with XRE-family HTH domain